MNEGRSMSLTDLATWIGLVVAFATASLALREYRTTQQWKRAEFLAAEVDKFFQTTQVATALLLIDYSLIRLGPDGQRAARDTPKSFKVDDETMIRALQLHTEFEDETEKFNDQEIVVRLAFDELLTGFERFAHHVESSLVSLDALKTYVGYWVEKLADPRSKWKPAEFYISLARFVDAYQYKGAQRLFRQMGHPLPAVTVSTATSPAAAT
jgi:hypothetical protein